MARMLFTHFKVVSAVPNTAARIISDTNRFLCFDAKTLFAQYCLISSFRLFFFVRQKQLIAVWANGFDGTSAMMWSTLYNFAIHLNLWRESCIHTRVLTFFPSVWTKTKWNNCIWDIETEQRSRRDGTGFHGQTKTMFFSSFRFHIDAWRADNAHQ